MTYIDQLEGMAAAIVGNFVNIATAPEICGYIGVIGEPLYRGFVEGKEG